MITLITMLVNFKHYTSESTDPPGTGHGSPGELVTDPLRSAEHILGTAAVQIDDR